MSVSLNSHFDVLNIMGSLCGDGILVYVGGYLEKLGYCIEIIFEQLFHNIRVIWQIITKKLYIV